MVLPREELAARDLVGLGSFESAVHPGGRPFGAAITFLAILGFGGRSTGFSRASNSSPVEEIWLSSCGVTGLGVSLSLFGVVCCSSVVSEVGGWVALALAGAYSSSWWTLLRVLSSSSHIFLKIRRRDSLLALPWGFCDILSITQSSSEYSSSHRNKGPVCEMLVAMSIDSFWRILAISSTCCREILTCLVLWLARSSSSFWMRHVVSGVRGFSWNWGWFLGWF